ncbi:MAG: hypothetical protein ACFFBJ_04015, partial [Promethearchaeota archaeon]
NISTPDLLYVVLAGSPGLETSKILTDPSSRARINAKGDELVSRVIESPTIDTFVDCSREFSNEIGLKTPRIEKAIDELDKAGLSNSSMVMLGDSVFCLCDESESSKAEGILSRYWKTSEVFVTRVEPDGGRLLE